MEQGAPPHATESGEVFEIRKDGELVAVVTDRPGFVLQRGAPPPLPNAPPPPSRPFSMEAYALSPGAGVMEAIEDAKSTRVLLTRLQALGYTVTATQRTP